MFLGDADDRYHGGLGVWVMDLSRFWDNVAWFATCRCPFFGTPEELEEYMWRRWEPE